MREHEGYMHSQQMHTKEETHDLFSPLKFRNSAINSVAVTPRAQMPLFNPTMHFP